MYAIIYICNHENNMLVPVNQRVLKKLRKEHNITGNNTTGHTECSNLTEAR